MNMFKPINATSFAGYFAAIVDPQRRADVQALDRLIRKTVPKLKPFIERSMLGYGKYHYRSKSGREGDWATIGLASQKQYISLYCCAVKDGKYVADAFRDRLPKADVGKSCVRFKKLSDVDQEVIAEMLRVAEKYPMGAV